MDLDSEDVGAILEEVAREDEGALVGIAGGTVGGIGGVGDGVVGWEVVAVDLLSVEVKDAAVIDLVGELVVGVFAQRIDGGEVERGAHVVGGTLVVLVAAVVELRLEACDEIVGVVAHGGGSCEPGGVVIRRSIPAGAIERTLGVVAPVVGGGEDGTRVGLDFAPTLEGVTCGGVGIDFGRREEVAVEETVGDGLVVEGERGGRKVGAQAQGAGFRR